MLHFIESNQLEKIQNQYNQSYLRSSVRHQVTLVGYGRYGKYIGPKYAKYGYPWDIKTVVDPAVTSQQFYSSVLGIQKPTTKLYKNFNRWRQDYFEKLSASEKCLAVVELALPANLVLEQASLYIKAGVKNLILPKPVVDSEDSFIKLVKLVKQERVKAVVSSQWHYSSLPKIIARDIKRLTQQSSKNDSELNKIVINFSKENGTEIALAPLCELPHCIQILDSMGVLNKAKRAKVTGDKHSVMVSYQSSKVKNGIHAIGEMDYQRTPAQKNLYPQWDYQERKLQVFAGTDLIRPIVEVDFWIKFSCSGESVVHLGKYTTYEVDGQVLSHGIGEDLLLNMQTIIFESFRDSYEVFLENPLILPLERYQNIGLELLEIHDLWLKLL